MSLLSPIDHLNENNFYVLEMLLYCLLSIYRRTVNFRDCNRDGHRGVAVQRDRKTMTSQAKLCLFF